MCVSGCRKLGVGVGVSADGDGLLLGERTCPRTTVVMMTLKSAEIYILKW